MKIERIEDHGMLYEVEFYNGMYYVSGKQLCKGFAANPQEIDEEGYRTFCWMACGTGEEAEAALDYFMNFHRRMES